MNEEITKWFVNEYLINKRYGGPEEGGWWFDVGEFVCCHGEFDSYEGASKSSQVYSHLAEQYNRERGSEADINSVNCTGVKVIAIEGKPGANWPKVRPFYC